MESLHFLVSGRVFFVQLIFFVLFLILFAFCNSLFQSYSHSFDFIASDLFLLDDNYSSDLC